MYKLSHRHRRGGSGLERSCKKTHFPLLAATGSRYLRKLGFTAITTAVDGLDAFNAVDSSETPFDIIFMG